MSQLIKLSSDHYVIVDDSEIKEDGYALHESPLGEREIVTANGQCKLDRRITHSTQPLEYTTEDHLEWDKIKRISISEVKELLGEVDVEALARRHHYNGTIEGGYLTGGFINGYNQCLEDNKDKIFTYNEILTIAIRCWNTASDPMQRSVNNLNKIVDEYIQRLEPTEWEVEFIDGKLRLT